jgi:hypothetical protein
MREFTPVLSKVFPLSSVNKTEHAPLLRQGRQSSSARHCRDKEVISNTPYMQTNKQINNTIQDKELYIL